MTPALPVNPYPFGMGAHPSPFTGTDIALDLASLAIPVSPGQIIPVDHRSSFPPIQNQDSYPDCVTYSIADAAAAWIFRQSGKRIVPSHTFTNHQVHVEERTVGQEVGTYPIDAYKTLREQGVCHMSAWPDGQLFHDLDPHIWKTWFAYVPDPARRIFQGYPLPKDPYYEASHEKMTTFRAVARTGDAVQAALANGFDVCWAYEATADLFGITANGDYPYPAAAPIVGGHAMCVVGRLPDGRWINRNQYGTNWGDQGYCYLDKNWFDPTPPPGKPLLAIYDMYAWHASAVK